MDGSVNELAGHGKLSAPTSATLKELCSYFVRDATAGRLPPRGGAADTLRCRS